MEEASFKFGQPIALEFGFQKNLNEGVYVGTCNGLHITIFDAQHCSTFFWGYCENPERMLDYVTNQGSEELKNIVYNLVRNNPDARFFVSTAGRISLLVEESPLEDILQNLEREIQQ